MRQKGKAGSAWYQKAYEGKKEELADLDSRGIRPILEALEATGQLANTVIFFTSDNGYMLGEHRLTAKDKPYWESSEVPFFVKGPGIKKGSRAALVNHTDLMPTTCEIARILFSGCRWALDARQPRPRCVLKLAQANARFRFSRRGTGTKPWRFQRPFREVVAS
jgi:arylsulfatase A-like enzyme